MKKNFLLPLLGLIALPAIAQTTFTYEFEGQEVTYQVLSENNKTVTTAADTRNYYTDNSELTGSVVLPETVTYNDGSYTLTQIGAYSFGLAEELTSISIPKTVTTIGEGAFAWCDSLTDIYNYGLPQTLGDYAFISEDDNQDEIDLSEQITLHVASNALTEFNGWGGYPWKAIEAIAGYEVTFPAIEDGATFTYDGISYTVVSADELTCELTSPGNGNDYPQGSSIEGKIVIPETVRYYGKDLTVIGIGDSSFYYADYYGGAWTLTLPNTLQYIGEWAFEYCTKLTSLVCDSPVLESIGDFAFYDITNLEYLEINATSLTSVGNEICYDDANLKSVIFTGTPAEDVELTFADSGSYAGRQFRGCYALETLVLPTSLQNFTTRMIDMENTSETLKELIIPRGVKTIAQYAIRYENGITTLSIPAGIESINSGYGISGVGGLTDLYLFKTEPLEELGMRFGGKYSTPENITLYVPREGLEAYEGYQEQEWKAIQEIAYEEDGFNFVVLNDSDASLEGGEATDNAVVVPESIEVYTNILNVTEIGESAFADADVEEVVINANVTAIGEGAFNGANLVSVTVEALTPPAAAAAFTDLAKDAVLYVPTSALTAYQNAEDWNVFYRIRPIGYEAPDYSDAFTTSPADEAELSELATITVSSETYSGFTAVGNSIVINDVDTDVTAEVKDNNLVISLSEAVTTAGEYTVEIPAGFFTFVDGGYAEVSPALTFSVTVLPKEYEVAFTFVNKETQEFVTEVELDGDAVENWAAGFTANDGQELTLTFNMVDDFLVDDVTLNGVSILEDIEVNEEGEGTYTTTIDQNLTFSFDVKSGIADLSADSLRNVEIYTVNGLRVNNNNVNPGLYIIRKGDKVSKVLVK